MSCPREQAWRRRRWFCVTSLPGVQPEPDSAEARPDLCTAVVVRAWLRPRPRGALRDPPPVPSRLVPSCPAPGPQAVHRPGPSRRPLASARRVAQRAGLCSGAVSAAATPSSRPCPAPGGRKHRGPGVGRAARASHVAFVLQGPECPRPRGRAEAELSGPRSH